MTKVREVRVYGGKEMTLQGQELDNYFGVENNGHDLSGYGLGNVRTIRDYEKYAGIHFKKKSFQKYTKDNFFSTQPLSIQK